MGPRRIFASGRRHNRCKQRVGREALVVLSGRENALHPIDLLLRFPNFGREHLTLTLAGGVSKNAAGKVKFAASRARMPRDTLCLRKEKPWT
jgi:hypothetical protein